MILFIQKRINWTLGAKVPGMFTDATDPWKYRRNLLKLEVYFEELNFEKVSEKPAYNASTFSGFQNH